MSFFSNIGQAIAKVTVEPIAKVTASGINALFGTNIKPMTTEQAAKTKIGQIYFPALAGAAVVAAASPISKIISSAGGVTTVAQKAATTILTKPATVIKAASVAGAGVVATNILVSSPKAREAVINTPTSLSNFGQNIGKVIENPSKETILQTVKENPIVAGAAVASTAALVGYGTSSLIASVANTKAIQENTKASDRIETVSNLPLETKGSEQPINIINQIPASSPVTSSSPVSKTKPKATKRKAKKKKKVTKKKKKVTKKKKSIKRKKNKK